MSRETNRRVQSVNRAFAVLDTLKRLDGAGVTELHEELGLALGTTHAYLSTLRVNDAVVKRNGEYHVGFGSLEYAGYAREELDFYQHARESMHELAEGTGELVAISTEEHGQNVYLGYEEGRRAANIDIELGSRLPLHCLGSGKAILSALPDERVSEIVAAQGLESMTDNTLTDEAGLKAELEAIRNRGVAFDDEERIEGMRAVAAPIRNDETDEVYGAITVSGPKTRVQGSRFREGLPEMVHNAAREVIVNVTYS